MDEEFESLISLLRKVSCLIVEDELLYRKDSGAIEKAEAISSDNLQNR